VVVLAVLLVFWPVCGHQFLIWDDYPAVAANAQLNPVTLQGVLWFWAHPYMSIYIPVTYTFWGVLAAMGRGDVPDANGIWLNPYLFHTANLIVHMLAALAAYGLLLRLTRRAWAACAGALLFALHPVQVEAVAWVAGMKDLLCGMFSLVTLWQYVAFAQTAENASTARRRWHYGAAAVAFALALLSKPAAMSLPVAAVAIDRWIVGRSWRQVAFSAAPWLGMAIPIAVFARIAQPVSFPADGGHVWLRPLLATHALAFYLYKLVFPAKLAVQYHQAPGVIIANRWLYVTWIAPAAVAIAIAAASRSRKWLIAGGVVFLAGVLPVLGLAPFQFEAYSLVSDHYLYTAMLGPAIVVAFVMTSTSPGKAAPITCGVVLGILGARSFVQTWCWRDTQTLFEHNLAVNPVSNAAYENLAAWNLMHKDPAKALDQARYAIELDPSRAQPYVTLSNAQLRLGQLNNAIQAGRKACDLAPNNPVALANLAGLLAQANQLDEAIKLARRELQFAPDDAATRMNLAIMLFRKGDRQGAVDQARQAVDQQPGDGVAQTKLGFLLEQTGQMDESARHYQAALQLNPNNALAGQGLERIQRSRGR